MFNTAQSGDAVLVSRSDPDDLLSAWSRHAFDLDDREWPSVEHYYQAMKFEDPELREAVRAAATPAEAEKLGRKHKRRLRKDWKSVKRVIMTRALYIKCRTYAAAAERLLATGTRPIVETSQYDYYWGCGRDLRGNNVYGRILMEIRDKLRGLEPPA